MRLTSKIELYANGACFSLSMLMLFPDCDDGEPYGRWMPNDKSL
jgi:hypothetical protein